MKMLRLIAAVFLFAFAAWPVSGEDLEVSIVRNKKWNSYGLVKGRAKSYIAMGSFRNDINKTGWAYLEVKTNPRSADTEQAYAAGLLEGFFTKDLIELSWYNLEMDIYCTKPVTGYCKRLQDFLDANGAWMQEQIDKKAGTNTYWHQVRLFLIQLQGLMDGYRLKPSDRSTFKNSRFKPDVTSLLMLQIFGDLDALESALNKTDQNRAFGADHCSALIKLLPGNTDLYVAHDTWFRYQSMLRILKKYAFGFHLTPGSNQIVPGNEMTFSSYPGSLLSLDDFYDISTGLVTLETSLTNYNSSRWSYVKPENAVFEGIRNMVANRLATSGKEWVDYFRRFNSGTYNNQWMVVDYKRFTPRMPALKDGLLYVLEQIPGMIESKDMTETLRMQSYWPSYNCPAFPAIFSASENQLDSECSTYENGKRAMTFRRDHIKVKNVKTMTKLMRCESISLRDDEGFFGGTDMKLTTSKMMKDLEFVAICGPTYDGVPPFQWSKYDYDSTVRHKGQPDLWKFKPIQHKWTM